MTAQRKHPRPNRIAESPVPPRDGADSAEAAQHREDQSEIGGRVGSGNESQRGLDRNRRAKPVVR